MREKSAERKASAAFFRTREKGILHIRIPSGLLGKKEVRPSQRGVGCQACSVTGVLSRRVSAALLRLISCHHISSPPSSLITRGARVLIIVGAPDTCRSCRTFTVLPARGSFLISLASPLHPSKQEAPHHHHTSNAPAVCRCSHHGKPPFDRDGEYLGGCSCTKARDAQCVYRSRSTLCIGGRGSISPAPIHSNLTPPPEWGRMVVFRSSHTENLLGFSAHSLVLFLTTFPAVFFFSADSHWFMKPFFWGVLPSPTSSQLDMCF